jgi:AraC-like DNA-binding protein
MKFFLVIGTFQALFYSILIIQKRNKGFNDYILIVWLLYLGIFIGGYGFFSEEIFVQYSFLTTSYISLLLLHGPFLYFYTLSLVYPAQKVIRFRQLLHFLPFLLFNIYIGIMIQHPEALKTLRLDYVTSGDHPSTLFLFFLVITALSGPVYVVFTIHIFRKHDHFILENFSYKEQINLGWIKNVLYSFGIVWTVLIVVTILHHVFYLFSAEFCINGMFLSLSAFVIIIGYIGIKQSVIHIPENVSQISGQTTQRYAGSGLGKSEAEDYAVKLKEIMNVDKPFLDPKLNINKLAEMVDMPSYYLSQVINENFGKNFYEFINHYRVEEVKRKIDNGQFKHYSLLGISYDSGFNSKATFNRFFKKITGNTPGNYKKKVLQQE